VEVFKVWRCKKKTTIIQGIKEGEIPPFFYLPKKQKVLKIKEAIEMRNSKYEEQIKMIDLAKELWPESSIKTQRMNIMRLCSGETRSIKIDHISMLCDRLICDANYLFGQD